MSVSSLCSEFSRPAAVSMSKVETDRVVAVCDLEHHVRLEVLRAAIAIGLAVGIPLQSAQRRVLDVHVDERTAVEAGQVEQRALVDPSAVRHCHVTLLSWSSRGGSSPQQSERAEQARQDSNPDQRGWSSPCSRYTTGLQKRTTRIERASPEWRPGALPSELRPREHARLESNQRPLPSQSSALSTELRAWKEPPAGIEPAPRPYKGRVLAVDTTEA